MSKNGVTIGVIVVSLVAGMVFLFLLVTQFPPLWSFLSPRPPKPEIKNGEFAFRLEYEREGKTIIVEDAVIVEYGGTNWNAGSGNNNVWNTRFESGNETIELYRDDTDVLFVHILEIMDGIQLFESSITQGDGYRELLAVTRVSLRDKDLLSSEEENMDTFFRKTWKPIGEHF